MPVHHYAERHSLWVAAPPSIVFAAMSTADLARPWPVRLLMGLRAAPAILASPRAAWRRRQPRAPATLRTVLGYDFVRLAEDPGRELVLGIEGRFWTPTGGLVGTDPAAFRGPVRPGLARGAWNFSVEPESRDGRAGSRLATETRVLCADAAARRSFARYWRIVRPFSGLIRRNMLAMIRRDAERRVSGTHRG